MAVGDKRRLVTAIGVSEWETFRAHATALGETQLALDLAEEQHQMLVILLDRDGYLFYPGHTDLTEGPALALRYCTEHEPELGEVLNPEK